MKRLSFTYDLTLSFGIPVSRHTFLMRFAPQTDTVQQLWGVETHISPNVTLAQTQDAFGNRGLMGHLEQTHQHIDFSVRGDALVHGTPLAASCPAFYAMQTPLTYADAGIAALCEGLNGSAQDIALAAAQRIGERVTYQKGVTNEHTTAAQSLALGAGVCQDLAHLLLSMLRELGIPARYVAGLIPGEGETHAWVEVYDGQRFIGVDPTHHMLTDDRYLRVNVGRDSGDCAINRGVFAGNAVQHMDVRVKMIEI